MFSQPVTLEGSGSPPVVGGVWGVSEVTTTLDIDGWVVSVVGKEGAMVGCV